jgi:hypothetical protein
MAWLFLAKSWPCSLVIWGLRYTEMVRRSKRGVLLVLVLVLVLAIVVKM